MGKSNVSVRTAKPLHKSINQFYSSDNKNPLHTHKLPYDALQFGNNHSNICSHILQQGTAELCQQLKQIINKTTLALHAVINQLPLNIKFPGEHTQKCQVIFSSGVNDLMLILKLATINVLTSGAGLYTVSFSYQPPVPPLLLAYTTIITCLPVSHSVIYLTIGIKSWSAL